MKSNVDFLPLSVFAVLTGIGNCVHHADKTVTKPVEYNGASYVAGLSFASPAD